MRFGGNILGDPAALGHGKFYNRRSGQIADDEQSGNIALKIGIYQWTACVSIWTIQYGLEQLAWIPEHVIQLVQGGQAVAPVSLPSRGRSGSDVLLVYYFRCELFGTISDLSLVLCQI